jgi:hypothetical protein
VESTEWWRILNLLEILDGNTLRPFGFFDQRHRQASAIGNDCGEARFKVVLRPGSALYATDCIVFSDTAQTFLSFWTPVPSRQRVSCH